MLGRSVVSWCPSLVTSAAWLSAERSRGAEAAAAFLEERLRAPFDDSVAELIRGGGRGNLSLWGLLFLWDDTKVDEDEEDRLHNTACRATRHPRTSKCKNRGMKDLLMTYDDSAARG